MAERPRDQWLRLQAVQIIAMLPENTEEGRRILAYAGHLLDVWCSEVAEAPAEPEREKPRPAATVLSLVQPD